MKKIYLPILNMYSEVTLLRILEDKYGVKKKDIIKQIPSNIVRIKSLII